MNDHLINPNTPTTKGYAINGMPAIYLGKGLCIGISAQTNEYHISTWGKPDTTAPIFIKHETLDVCRQIIQRLCPDA